MIKISGILPFDKYIRKHLSAPSDLYLCILLQTGQMSLSWILPGIFSSRLCKFEEDSFHYGNSLNTCCRFHVYNTQH